LKLLDQLESNKDFLGLGDYFDGAPGPLPKMEFDKIEIKEDANRGRFVEAKQNLNKG
jgi:hypothetical protein